MKNLKKSKKNIKFFFIIFINIEYILKKIIPNLESRLNLEAIELKYFS